jgi:biotin carboxylase
MPRRVLLLATTTGYQTRVFAEAARRLGIEPVLATDQCHKLDDPWGDGAITVRFHNPVRYAGILAANGPFDGIVAVGDRPAFLAAMAAERLGIPFHPPAAVEASRNKYLARERFRAAGMNAPAYFRVPITADPRETARRAAFPCVLKPLGLSASRGVIRANGEQEFTAAFERIKALLCSVEIRMLRDEQDRFIQIEDFIPGREFALEGIVTRGQLQTLALFDKPDPLDGPFFEETLYVTPSREPASVQRALVHCVEQAIRALGLEHGPVHAELRYNERGAWMLEAAARPIGGLCARALRFDDRMSLEELILRHALGEDVSRQRLMDGASGVMMIPIPREGIYEDVDGLADARVVPGIADIVITAKPAQKLVPLPEGSSYLGFIFARGASADHVESALRSAHALLEFRIGTALPVVRGGLRS